MSRVAVGSPSGRTGVEVNALTVTLEGSDVPVVTDIAFSILPGRVMGLVGESGSGKTTVGLALLAYARAGLKIASGSVWIGGTNVLDLSPSALRKVRGRLVAYIPQDPASGLNPAHRVGAQLREVFRIHRDAIGDEDVETRVTQLLTEVRLPHDILQSYPHQLSGGQQQRIAVAMAFAFRPQLIVLDEPTTGLDVTTQRHVLDTIRTLADSYQVTAIYVSHDLAVVGLIAHDTAVMYAGRIVEYGATATLFSDPRHPYTSGLLKAAPHPDRSVTLVGIEGRPPRPGRWPPGCSFADRCARVTESCSAALPPLSACGTGRIVRCIHPLAGGGRDKASMSGVVPSAQNGEIVLQVSGLAAHYGREDVVHDVDFQVGSGNCTAIVGESGSGKTTLARCVIGLHTRWQGEVRLDGASLARSAHARSTEQRRRIQYVFQNPFASLNPTLTVAENVEEPLRHFDRAASATERRRRAIEMLGTVSLNPEYADRLPGRLSGGERQRVAVARALIVDPDVLICDEITSALDVSVQALLIEQLRRLQVTRGLSMVFITHNLPLVRSIAQNVVVLEHGHVVDNGPVQTVLERPAHAYTRQLITDLPRLAEAESRARATRPAEV